MMIKIGDEPSGKVREDYIEKYSTSNDVSLLAEGSAVAGAILKEAGVDPNTLHLHLLEEPIPVVLLPLEKLLIKILKLKYQDSTLPMQVFFQVRLVPLLFSQ